MVSDINLDFRSARRLESTAKSGIPTSSRDRPIQLASILAVDKNPRRAYAVVVHTSDSDANGNPTTPTGKLTESVACTSDDPGNFCFDQWATLCLCRR